MKKFVLVVVVIIFATSTAMGAEIRMREYIEQVRRSHPFFKKTDIDAAVVNSEAESLRGVSDFHLTFRPYMEYSKPLADFDLVQIEKIQGSGYQAGISKQLWNTGTRFELLFDQKKQRYDIFDRISENRQSKDCYTSGISFNIIQPLLKNFRGRLDRLEFDVKRFDVEMTAIQSLERKEDFIYNLAVQFLLWVHLNEQKTIADKQLHLAKLSHAKNRNMFRANLTGRVSMLQSEEDLQLARQNLKTVEAQWEAQRKKLAILSGDASILQKNPSFEMYHVIEFPDETQAKTRFAKTSRVLRLIRKQEQQLRLLEQRYENMSLPELSLVFSGKLQQSRETHSDLLHMKKSELYVGLQFSVPIENTDVSNKLEKTEQQIAQVRYEAEEIRKKMESELISMLTVLRNYKDILSMNRTHVELAMKRNAEELKLYYQGGRDYFYVIESRNREQMARLQYAANAIEYQTLYLQYLSLTDQLVKDKGRAK